MSLLNTTTIELFKEDMKFSAGHFTIFSATERENFHGHNYQVHVAITASMQANGMSFNYRVAKEKIRALCANLDETFLLPANSPHLKITQTEEAVLVQFSKEHLQFLPRDVTCLEIENITVEALAAWFVDALLFGEHALPFDNTIALRVKIFSGGGQSGERVWEKTSI